MDFDPAFALLAKFSTGLPSPPKSEGDIRAVATYLGVDLSEVGLDDRISLLSNKLSNQNGFLSTQLELDLVFRSDEYRKCMFIREVVANNRINRENRIAADG